MVTLRDLQWRARRSLLGALATALVFATTLLLTGLHASFINETTRTVGLFNADRWIVPNGVSGPFTTNAPLRTAVAAHLRTDPGVRGVSAVAIFRNVIHDRDRVRDVNVIGYQSGPVFRPRVTSGRAPARSGEVIVDEKLGLEPGDRIGLAGRELHVVGLTRGLRYYGGTPGMLMLLRDAQQIAYGGQQLASALVVQGVPTRRLDGFTAMTRDAVTRDLRRPLGSAIRTIGVLSVILWLVAAGIIALMVYLSSLDRRVDFAVYKAIGVPTRQLLGGLVLQVLLLALGAAAVATIASFVLAPLFPIPLEISGRAYIQLFATATLAGLVASSVSVRQASRVDPALAFGRGA